MDDFHRVLDSASELQAGRERAPDSRSRSSRELAVDSSALRRACWMAIAAWLAKCDARSTSAAQKRLGGAAVIPSVRRADPARNRDSERRVICHLRRRHHLEPVIAVEEHRAPRLEHATRQAGAAPQLETDLLRRHVENRLEPDEILLRVVEASAP